VVQWRLRLRWCRCRSPPPPGPSTSMKGHYQQDVAHSCTTRLRHLSASEFGLPIRNLLPWWLPWRQSTSTGVPATPCVREPRSAGAPMKALDAGTAATPWASASNTAVATPSHSTPTSTSHLTRHMSSILSRLPTAQNAVYPSHTTFHIPSLRRTLTIPPSRLLTKPPFSLSYVQGGHGAYLRPRHRRQDGPCLPRHHLRILERVGLRNARRLQAMGRPSPRRRIAQMLHWHRTHL